MQLFIYRINNETEDRHSTDATPANKQTKKGEKKDVNKRKTGGRALKRLRGAVQKIDIYIEII